MTSELYELEMPSHFPKQYHSGPKGDWYNSGLRTQFH